jgi:hypothetical protein
VFERERERERERKRERDTETEHGRSIAWGYNKLYRKKSVGFIP